LSYKFSTKNHSVYFTGLENGFWGEKNKIGAKNTHFNIFINAED
jgi:hypothetical protein